jgi:hypothetical protein
MRHMLRLVTSSVALLILAGCQTIPSYKVNHRLVQQGQPPAGDVIVLPLDIKVKEFSASGLTEEVPDWTRQAVANFRQQLQHHDPELLPELQLRFMPEQPAEDMARVEEHLALNDRVMGNAFVFSGPTGGEAWKHKAKHFDYSLGPGLAFLAERTGADKALILMGEDVHSSEGRKAAFLVAAAFGVGIPLGHSVAVASLVDLRSGDVLWMHYYISAGNVSFLNEEDTRTVVTELFKPFPGIEDYRRFVKGE